MTSLQLRWTIGHIKYLLEAAVLVIFISSLAEKDFLNDGKLLLDLIEFLWRDMHYNRSRVLLWQKRPFLSTILKLEKVCLWTNRHTFLENSSAKASAAVIMVGEWLQSEIYRSPTAVQLYMITGGVTAVSEVQLVSCSFFAASTPPWKLDCSWWTAVS